MRHSRPGTTCAPLKDESVWTAAPLRFQPWIKCRLRRSARVDRSRLLQRWDLWSSQRRRGGRQKIKEQWVGNKKCCRRWHKDRWVERRAGHLLADSCGVTAACSLRSSCRQTEKQSSNDTNSRLGTLQGHETGQETIYGPSGFLWRTGWNYEEKKPNKKQ